MELQQLRYVIAVSETLNFTRAAERCHVVQSALSHQVARLEAQLGVSLFERSSRRVRLTPAGEAFVLSARPAVAPNPGTTFRTPSGTPASRASSASRSAESGDCSAGFSTTELPMASAGASFHVAISSGKFHGTTAPITPKGTRRTMARSRPPVGAISS